MSTRFGSASISRRAFLAGAGTCLATSQSFATVPSLAEIGRAKGIDIGCAWGGQGPDAYRQILARHCGLIVHEWQMKPRFLRPDQFGTYRFEEADAITDIARRNGQKLHGHALFWHQEPIRWAESVNFDAVKRRYGGFIHDVVGRHPDFVSWDVMAEIIEEKAVLRDEFLLNRFSYDFIDFCFRAAHEASPNASLVINDYNLECNYDYCQTKRGNILSVLERLQAMGTPVHAVGIQAHLSSRWLPGIDLTSDFIAELGELGLEVYISEIDVNDIDFADDIVTRDRQVADMYEDFLTMALRHPNVRRVVFWGMADPVSWMNYGGDDVRADPRPALFDASFTPKPAFEAARRALEAAAER